MVTKLTKAEEEMSKTSREIELCLQTTGEALPRALGILCQVMRLPAQVSTTAAWLKNPRIRFESLLNGGLGHQVVSLGAFGQRSRLSTQLTSLLWH